MGPRSVSLVSSLWESGTQRVVHRGKMMGGVGHLLGKAWGGFSSSVPAGLALAKVLILAFQHRGHPFLISFNNSFWGGVRFSKTGFLCLSWNTL